jgi:hypothetical protein
MGLECFPIAYPDLEERPDEINQSRPMDPYRIRPLVSEKFFYSFRFIAFALLC